MKIGILGGTFDPIHNGHLMIGRYARDLFGLDEVWVMPNGKPPHKAEGNMETETFHRIEMVRRAIENELGFVLELYEVERKETNYSYLTMEHFRQVYPNHEFYFIVGADSLFTIEKWRYPERLLKTCIMLAAFRDGKKKHEMEEQIAYLNQKYDADIRLLLTPDVDISSTDIRETLKSGKCAEDTIPERVLSYIKEHGLYTYDVLHIKEKLSCMLRSERYEHTLGVVETAVRMAEYYGEPVEKARVAALLHDCAKCLGRSELISHCEKNRIAISESEERNPSLLHAKVGALIANERFGIKDEEILSAISCHTTGRPNMSRLEKILYVADYIEPNRTKAPNLDQIRRLAYEDLDQCVCRILEATLAYLRTTCEVIDPTTENTYLFYKKKGQ